MMMMMMMMDLFSYVIQIQTFLNVFIQSESDDDDHDDVSRIEKKKTSGYDVGILFDNKDTNISVFIGLPLIIRDYTD